MHKLTRNVLLFLIILTCALDAQSQSVKEHLQKGERYFLKKDYENALTYFVNALELEPRDAMLNYKAGVCYSLLGDQAAALSYLENAYALNPEVDPDISYYLGIAYKSGHQYSKAREHYELIRKTNPKFASVIKQRIAECITGDSLMRLPSPGEVVSLKGEDVNTNFSEFGPVLSSDGNTLYFSSNRSKDAFAVKARTNTDDVYVSHRGDTAWSAPVKAGVNINVPENEVITSISADGKTLFIYYEDGGGDIYTSVFENGEWQKPTALNRFINHPTYRESAACVSADGKRLYFSSNRPGGKGGFDIYVSEMGPNGQWGRPTNLGSTINSRLDELSPFIAADGTTLYFSSNGHPTLGDHDIFRSRLVDGKWTLPENLGYPVNSSGNDGFFWLSPDRTTGYFSSQRQSGRSDADIYSVKFREEALLIE